MNEELRLAEAEEAEEPAAVSPNDEEPDEQGEEEEREEEPKAPVLDTGRPTAPLSWRSLPPVEQIRQGIVEADRRARRR